MRKAHFIYVFVFLLILKEDNSCAFTADEQLGSVKKENI